MFRKIHLRLTLFADGIIAFILLIMTFGYLYISEKNLLETRLLSYQSDILTIASNLEQQPIITHSWLTQLESRRNYYLSLTDNGVPFLFNSLENTHTDTISQAWDSYYAKKDALKSNVLSYRCYYDMFSFTDSAKEEYFVFVIHTGDENSGLEMLLLSPILPLKLQIQHQRVIFLGIVSEALILLCGFSWFFIGKLIYPIEESRKRQNRFIAAASHELRTPLAVILSCVEDMQDNENSFPFIQSLSVVHDESLRMSKLLEDMLTLSSQTDQPFSLQKEPVELDTLLLNTSEAFESLAKSKKISITVSLPDHAIPPLICDKARIRQLLSILLHNAVSYTPEEGSIKLSLNLQKDYFHLQVADTGSGIPDDEKDKIFECFYRSETARSSKGHFGLGLSIAAQIVEAHHGSIFVSDNKGGGAVFTVKFPIGR